MKTVKKEIDANKCYAFADTVIKPFEDVFLVIAPNTANWLVLKNDQVEMFQQLNTGKAIKEVIKELPAENPQGMQVLVDLLTQIEAKKFYEIVNIKDISKNLVFYLTNSCNLRCPHCYMFAGEKAGMELDFGQIVNILNEFKILGGTNVTFSGGEVTLRSDLLGVLKVAKELGLINTVLTNGTLWTEDMVRLAAPFIDEVQVSIDGYDELSNSRIRGKGNFSKALQAIDWFYSYGTRISVAFTPLFDGMEDFIQGFPNFARRLLESYPKNVQLKLNLEIIKGRSVNLTDSENEIYKSKLKTMMETVYPGYYRNTFALNHHNHLIVDNCGYGEITIGPDGEVYFCNRIYEITSIGNVKKLDFKQILMLSEQTKHETSVDFLTPCNKCDLKYICGGGCRIKYVPNLSLNDHTGKVIVRKDCDESYKEYFYRKMVECNYLFYGEV